MAGTLNQASPRVGLRSVRLPSVAFAGVCLLLAGFTFSDNPDVPAISRFDPSGGAAGRVVRIAGTGLASVTNVRFNDVPAAFTIDSNNEITATVPAGAGTGPLSVTGSSGSATSLADFAYSSPNIVLIMTDDQRWDTLQWLPTVESQLVAKGVTFNDSFVSNPLCCPSRASALTGQSSGNNGVWSNSATGPFAGFPAFKGHDDQTLPVWLQDAGYATALIGKYMNGYSPAYASYIPPGWTHWVGWLQSSTSDGGGYYDYSLSVDGTSVPYGSTSSDYSTDVYSQYASSFIRSAPPDRPLLLWMTPRAPHGPTTPPPRYLSACESESLPMPPSFNEADVSDKPAYIAGLPLFSPRKIARKQVEWQNACRTLKAVDDAVANVLQALTDTGRLSNTLLVFTSDNGLLFGEHRWRGKIVPYEESIRVPLVMRWDGVLPAGTSTNGLVTNLDYAPTLAAAAGVTPARKEDGLNLLPLAEGQVASIRSRFLIEHWGGTQGVPYCGVRSEGFMYAQYSTGEEELYDLSADPYELQNVAADRAYAAALDWLRAADHKLCDPPPPDWSWSH